MRVITFLSETLTRVIKNKVLSGSHFFIKPQSNISGENTSGSSDNYSVSASSSVKSLSVCSRLMTIYISLIINGAVCTDKSKRHSPRSFHRVDWVQGNLEVMPTATLAIDPCFSGLWGRFDPIKNWMYYYSVLTGVMDKYTSAGLTFSFFLHLV